MALLAANPAVRELLIKPLAIRQASLLRYTGAASGAAGRPKRPLPAAAAVSAAAAPQVVVAGAGLLPGAEADLSGDALGGSELEQEASEGQLAGMQRMASTVVAAVQDTFSL